MTDCINIINSQEDLEVGKERNVKRLLRPLD